MKNVFGIIVFDLDGTLVDSMPGYIDAFCQVLDEDYGVSPDISRKIFIDTSGLSLDKQFELALKRGEVGSNFRVDELVRSFWSIAEDVNVELMPNAYEVVCKLASAGYTLVVSSGSSSSVVVKRMRKAKIDKYFRLLLGTDIGSIDKMIKGKSHFGIIQRELSITKSVFKRNTIMIGDGPHDIIFAKKAGILSIAILTGMNDKMLRRTQADFYINNLVELITIFSASSPNSRRFLPVADLITT